MAAPPLPLNGFAGIAPPPPVIDPLGQPRPPVNPIDLTPAEFCRQINELCGRFESIGRRLRDIAGIGNKLKRESIEGIMKALGLFATIDKKWTDNYIERIGGQFKLAFEDANYLGEIKAYCAEKGERLFSLLVLRKFLDSLESAAVNVSTSQKNEAGLDQKADIDRGLSFMPSIFGLGGGAAGQVTDTARRNNSEGIEVSLAISIKIYTQPTKSLLDYCIHSTCPAEIPTISEAIGTFLANDITQDHLRCIVECRGGVWPEYQRVVLSNRAKLSAGEIVALRMRDSLTEDQYRTRIRELGFLLDREARELRVLAEQIPPFTDLIRFMVRDVEDERLVRMFQMDADFDFKWAGESEKWGRWQGISSDVMRRYWRAHWTIPSPTQLYEMYHRLRYRDLEDPARVDFDMVRTALQQQDILPFWIPRLLEISFNPLTRVDTQRAFFIGVFDREAVKRSYLDIGYSDDNAETLTKFTERLKFLRAINEPVAKLYREGAISEAALRERFRELRYSDEEINLAVQRIKRLQTDDGQRACVRALKQRFMTGEFIEGEAATQLTLRGIDNDSAERVARVWACEREARAKFPRATELCDAFTKGVISDDEFKERLVRIGYSDRDAEVTVSRCRISALERREAKAIAAARRAAAEQEKAQRRAQTDAEKLKRQQEAAAKARLAAAAKRDKIEAKLVKASSKLAAKLEIPVNSAMERIQHEFARLLHGGTPSADQLSQIAPLLASSLDATGRVTPAERERVVAADLQRMRDQPGYLPGYLSPELLQRTMEILGIGRRDRLEMASIIADSMERIPEGEFDLATYLDQEIDAWERAEASLEDDQMGGADLTAPP